MNRVVNHLGKKSNEIKNIQSGKKINYLGLYILKNLLHVDGKKINISIKDAPKEL